jgi:hypothetical protein
LESEADVDKPDKPESIELASYFDGRRTKLAVTGII